MADQTQRLEIATVKAEIGSDILSRFSNDAVAADPIPTDSGNIQNLKQVIVGIQDDAATKFSYAASIFTTTTAGLAATTDGAIFLVKSVESDEIYTVWQNVVGVATDTGKRALSAQAIEDSMVAADASADEAAASALAAQAAASGAAAEFEVIFDTDQADRAVEFESAQANRETQFNTFMDASGYESPIPYATGILLDRTTKTVSYLGDEYRARGAFIPFTTSNWAADAAKLKLIGDDSLRQGLGDATDPTKGASQVGWDGETVGTQMNLSKKLSNYTALGNYTGSATRIELTQTGIAGPIFRDPTVTAGDGGTTFLDGLGRGWRRNYEDEVHASWFGAVSGLALNQSVAINAAAAAAKAAGAGLRIAGTYRLTEPVDFRDLPLFAADATFYLDAVDKIGVLLGGNASQSWNPPQDIGKVFRADESLTVPSVRVMGAKGQKIYIGRTHYLQLYASTSAPDRNRNYSIAYNTFHLGHINKLEFNTDPANAGGPANSETGGTIQWINENFIYINRCHGLLIDGSYTHNHNTIVGGSWEGPVTIDMNIGFHNKLLNARLEEGPTTIKFGVNAANCWIQKSWDGVIDDRQTGIISGTITDLGTSNVVADDFSLRHNITCVASASITDPWVNFTLDLPARAPHLQRIGGTAGNAPVMISDKIRIERNMQFYWTWSDYDAGDTVYYRPFLEFFDKNGVPINASTSWVLTPGLSTPSGNYLSTGSGVGSSNYWATIIQPALAAGAMFVRVGTRISSGQVANSVARNMAIHCSLPPTATHHPAATEKRYAKLVVTSPPTQGFVPVGFSCFLNTGAAEYYCSFAFESTLVGAVASGSNTIVVAAATGVAVGDRVGVNMDNRDTLWPTVTAIAGTTLTLSTTLVFAAAAGSRVTFNRQITK